MPLVRKFRSKDRNPEQVLDMVFSIYTRIKDANDFGMTQCCTCQKVDHWTMMHCGHFIGRHHNATRFSIENAHAQCPVCNTSTDQITVLGKYKEYLRGRYGHSTPEDLTLRSNVTTKFYAFEYEEMARFYWSQAKDMAKEKGIVLNEKKVEDQMSSWQEVKRDFF